MRPKQLEFLEATFGIDLCVDAVIRVLGGLVMREPLHEKQVLHQMSAPFLLVAQPKFLRA